MDQKQTRVDLNASVITQNQNLLNRTAIPTSNCLIIGISSDHISLGLMKTIRTECTNKVWESVRNYLFNAIYACVDAHFKNK
jgi:hypothetical protein